MFKHLLIPLDGSHLAESVLPVAAFLAVALDAKVTLLHVIEHHAPKEIHSDYHLKEADEAMVYLENIAKTAFPDNVRVTTHVHTAEVSDVARSIVEHSDELKPDLVVMCTHGHTGVRDWLVGSIAQQVIARGVTPVMLVRPGGEESRVSFECRCILLALDGNSEHEQGIPVAVTMAQVCHAPLHMLMVVHTFGTLTGGEAAASRLQPGVTSALLDLAEMGAEEYLRRQIDILKPTGLKLTGEVRRGDPPSEIIESAHERAADMIVLGTHGKTGMDAFWSGSVTPKISSKTRVPILLVPVIEQ